MSAKRQLALLWQYDLRLSEVNRYEVKQIFNRILHLIAVEWPDCIVSWDNRTNFESLNYEANWLKIREKDRPWRTIQLLDLRKFVVKEVWKGKGGTSLEKMCRLLHLSRVKYHQARNDVTMIEQILKFYVCDLERELNCHWSLPKFKI